ncbi:MAG: aldehyde dehydrogenase family protein [Euryarchaeota archaeon]|nr:aldehyde dehydrogenase family protein [Euryarchaeota archaeon]
MSVRSIDPRTGAVIKEMPCSSKADVRSALDKARVAQRSWSSLSANERIEVLRQAEALFQKDKESMIDLIQSEGGFPRTEIVGAFAGAMKGVEYYADICLRKQPPRIDLDQVSWPNTEVRVEYVPHGVIGHIGIWNYPFWQTMITAIPALMAGNAVVFKPSEHTTLTGLRIAETFMKAGLPEGVFTVLVGGKEIGEEMVRSDFDAIVFTGGLDTGLSILHTSGVKPLILELSGNDPGIVCSDANIEQAARGIANGTFGHGGQVCIRVKRLYVTESISGPFIKEFLQVVDRIDVREKVGPLIREEARAKVHRSVNALIANGAKLLRGGEYVDGPGFYYKPTVLLIENGDSIDLGEEIFGPVCPIVIVKDEEEAVRMANESRFGLGASVWTSDPEKGRKIASKLEAGTVWVNECGRTLTGGENFHGWKSSGIATSQDRYSMFLKKRTLIQHTTCEPREHWMK